MRTSSEIESILKDVRARLASKQHATGINLTIPKDGFVQDHDWLNIIVTPAANGVRAYQYVDTLSEVERELKESGVDHVLLVPAIAD